MNLPGQAAGAGATSSPGIDNANAWRDTADMEILDLTAEHEALFHVCLEDWSSEIQEGLARRVRWHARMKERGLRVKLARDDRGKVVGMIQYSPIEHSFVDGAGLHFVHCIWVHGHRQGPGDCRGHGLGQALLAAAEQDARDRGAGGLAAWGLWLPFWMKASWFKRQGYRKADREGLAVLVWKRFRDDAAPPRWFPARVKPTPIPGKVLVTVYSSGWCSAQNLAYERARRAAAELGDRVVYREVDTLDRQVVAATGRPSAMFIDDREIHTGPPPSYEKLRGLIAKRLRRL